ncbi:MAG TPA: aquaporin [Candidatus Dormibacteraeota bacterium]
MSGRLDFRAYVAEFIGTFALIFVGVGAIAGTSIGKDQPGLVAIALAHGLTIAVMASATAAISGGHLNPAVTAGVLAAGRISPVNAAGYWVSQLLGAVAAAFLIQAVIPSAALHAVNLGTPAPAAGISGPSALLMEAVLTFFLMFVIYGTAVDRRAPKMAGLFIGLTVTLDILIGGPITGAAMNTARWFGPALLTGGLGNFWIYTIGPVGGAVAAAVLWRYFLESRVEPGATTV